MHFVLLLIFTLTAAGCTNNLITGGQPATAEKLPFPFIAQEQRLSNDTINKTWINDGAHHPLYFGVPGDTIFCSGYCTNCDSFEITDYLMAAHIAPVDSSTLLEIIVDTSQLISVRYNYAYPVLIKNLTSDSLRIGYGNYIPVIAEALNSEMQWQPIEERYIYMCGVGLRSLFLPPGQSVLTSQFVYGGTIKTKMRIRYLNNYSNEFFGYINETQFESEWNPDGSSKPDPNKQD